MTAPFTETIGGLVITRFPSPPPPDPPTPEELAQAEIDALEIEHLLDVQRITREVVITIAEERGEALGLTKAQLAAKNKGYAGLVALEEQIEELRKAI